MTPEEWKRCTDPRTMLSFLGDKISDRRLRLFGVACCRQLGGRLEDALGRQALDVAERHADGLATGAELARVFGRARRKSDRDWEEVVAAQGDESGVPAHAARAAARAAARDVEEAEPWMWAAWALAREAEEGAHRDSDRLFGEYVRAGAQPEDAWYEARRVAEEAAWEAGLAEAQRGQCPLLRDIVGDPWHPSTPPDPAVLAFNAGAARRLAESIYVGRRFEDLSVLADLLEEAGCTDAALLDHLRGPGPHALGCRALDAVLGKS
jgi:hypothetical protein